MQKLFRWSKCCIRLIGYVLHTHSCRNQPSSLNPGERERLEATVVSLQKAVHGQKPDRSERAPPQPLAVCSPTNSALTSNVHQSSSDNHDDGKSGGTANGLRPELDLYRDIDDPVDRGNVKVPKRRENVKIPSHDDSDPEDVPPVISGNPYDHIRTAAPNSLATTANNGSKDKREDKNSTA